MLITDDLNKKINDAIKEMLKKGTHETTVTKEGTAIAITVVRAGHLSENMQKRVFKEYETAEEKFYLVI